MFEYQLSEYINNFCKKYTCNNISLSTDYIFSEDTVSFTLELLNSSEIQSKSILESFEKFIEQEKEIFTVNSTNLSYLDDDNGMCIECTATFDNKKLTEIQKKNPNSNFFSGKKAPNNHLSSNLVKILMVLFGMIIFYLKFFK